MTDNEAIELIFEKHFDAELYFAEHDRYPKGYDYDFDQAILIAAQALKEIQKYREIGTVEECQKAMKKCVSIPEKKQLTGDVSSIEKLKDELVKIGWNDCIDKILNEKE